MRRRRVASVAGEQVTARLATAKGAKTGGVTPGRCTFARMPVSAEEATRGTTDRSKFNSESAAGAGGSGSRALPFASAGKLTSGASNARMIRPNRMLQAFHPEFSMELPDLTSGDNALQGGGWSEIPELH